MNNITIPLVVAPPFFLIFLIKLREPAIAHHELMIVASIDSLTSCLTRRAFTSLVDGYMDLLARDAPREGALLIIDIDHFKQVNDTFGHENGDEAIKSVANAIKISIREVDLVGRIGGEEFSVFLPGMTPKLTIDVAERIRATVRSLDFQPNGQRCALAVSVGGTTFHERASFTELFRDADERLYLAKRSGRDRVEIKRYGRSNGLAALH